MEAGRGVVWGQDPPPFDPPSLSERLLLAARSPPSCDTIHSKNTFLCFSLGFISIATICFGCYGDVEQVCVTFSGIIKKVNLGNFLATEDFC